MAETGRLETHTRRLNTGWYGRFAPIEKGGLDIGCAADPIHPECDFGPGEGYGPWLRYDWGINPAFNAQTLPTLSEDQTFHTVYASHILEHLDDPWSAVERWFKAVEPGGHLIICVPHRDLYEKRTELPSRWNGEHKYFWLPNRSEPRVTLNLTAVVTEGVERTGLPYEIVHCVVLNENYDANGDDHSIGEYSIEIIVKRVKLVGE